MTIPTAFDLSGRVAIVTGAGSPTGIGFESALLLGSLGAAVVVTSTTERIHERVEQLQAAGIDALGLVGDLTDAGVAPRLVEATQQRWGRVDVLVNNAGMVSQVAPDFESGTVATMSLDTWHSSLQRNLDTAFLMTRAVVPAMVEARWGRIVMVASVTGPVMAMSADIAYATAKAGMVGLMRALARDLAGNGVTVNAVAPGWIATGSQTPHEHLQGLATPAGRSAAPAEVAAAIGWLATPGASYTTGQCLVVDGGNSIAEERA